MFLLVPAHLGCPGQNPKSCKMVGCVYVCVLSVDRDVDATVETEFKLDGIMS